MEQADHLEEVGFDMVKTSRKPKVPTAKDTEEAKERVEKATH